MSAERRHTACASASTSSPSGTLHPDTAACTARSGRAPAQRRLGGDRVGERTRRVLDVVVGDENVGESDPCRLLGVDARAGDDGLIAFDGPTRRGRRCVPPRSGRIPYCSSSSPSVVPAPRTRQVARQCELQSGAEGVALHRGDRRVRRRLEPRERVLDGEDPVDRRVGMAVAAVLEHRRARPLGEHGRVDAARKGAAVADDDDRRAGRRRHRQAAPELAELRRHLGGEGVELLGAGEVQPPDVVVTLEPQRVVARVGHRSRRPYSAGADHRDGHRGLDAHDLDGAGEAPGCRGRRQAPRRPRAGRRRRARRSPAARAGRPRRRAAPARLRARRCSRRPRT